MHGMKVATRRVVRAFSGGAARPGWGVSKKNPYGPEIRDNQYFWDHPIYTGFTLWLRGVRPFIEKLSSDAARTLRRGGEATVGPALRFTARHNPDVRLQLTALASFYATASAINLALNRRYQAVVDLRQLQALDAAKRLSGDGFFDTAAADEERRAAAFAADHARLRGLWETALAAASAEEDADAGFAKLCEALAPQRGEEPQEAALTPPVTWRMDLIPYGADRPETQVVSPPPAEQPHRAFALNFTYNNLAYDWGDYLDRKDNKAAGARPVRQMFTDVYIPPTK